MFDFVHRKREFQSLQESFIRKVLHTRGCFSYLVQGRLGAGKTRLIQEFIEGIEADKRIASRIPNFRRSIHVIEYECSKEVAGPYLPFMEISRQIKKQQQKYRILKQIGMLAISFLPIHDVIEDFLKLGVAINEGQSQEAIRRQETRLFSKYMKIVNARSRKAPLIIYIKNVQWVDDQSLELLHTLIETENSLWGMIILEEDEVGVINPNLAGVIRRLIESKRMVRLDLKPLQKGFEIEMLESAFGPRVFNTTEFEHIYTLSEGCPGVLAGYVDDWLRKRWLLEDEEGWQTVSGFENKIKAPNQKLLDLLIALLQDGIISPREKILIKNFAEEWDIGEEVVTGMTEMIRKAQELGYGIERRVHSGAIGKDAFLAHDADRNPCIIEYVPNLEHQTQDVVPIEVTHPCLLQTREIKLFEKGALIVNEYFEGKTLKELNVEAYESHINNVLKMAVQVADGLAELHRNKLVHGNLRPESIVVTSEGEVRLAALEAHQLSSMNLAGRRESLKRMSYFSPEQINGQKLDARSDIFSFGVLLYELLTGELPFSGKNKGELKQAIQFASVPAFEDRKAHIPVEVQELIGKCLHKEPSNRIQDAGQLTTKMRGLILQGEQRERSQTKPSQAKHETVIEKNVRKAPRRLLVPAVVSFALIVAMLGFWLLPSGSSIDAVVVQDFKIELAEGSPEGQLSPEMLQYLLIDDIMQSSEVEVLSQQEFAHLHPENAIPRLQVSGAISPGKVGYIVSLALEPEKGSSQTATYAFADPSALLTSRISDMTMAILKLVGIEEKKKSTFTTSWDAFENFYKGEIAWKRLETTTARQRYSQALDIDSSFVLARLRLANVLRFGGSTDLAKRLVRSIRPKLPELSTMDSLKAEALTARLNGELRKEIDILRSIYNRFPTRRETSYEVAEAYYELCDIPNAIDFYKKALALDKDFARAHNHIGYCYSHLGEHEKALRHFRTYFRLDSTANALDSLGDGFMAAGKLDSAAWAKSAGLRLDPQLAYLYGSLCYIQIRQGKFNAADSSADQYLQHALGDDSKASGYFRKALIAYQRKDFNLALEHALHGKAIFDTDDPVTRDHDLHWLLGLLYMETGRMSEARSELAQMEEIMAAHHINATNYRMGIYKYARHLKACLAARQGELATVHAVVNEFDNRIENKLKDHTSPFDLAFLNTHLGEMMMDEALRKTSLAEARFRKALAYNENYALAHHGLYRLHTLAGHDDEGEQELATLSSLWRDADNEVRARHGLQVLAEK